MMVISKSKITLLQSCYQLIKNHSYFPLKVLFFDNFVPSFANAVNIEVMLGFRPNHPLSSPQKKLIRENALVILMVPMYHKGRVEMVP